MYAVHIYTLYVKESGIRACQMANVILKWRRKLTLYRIIREISSPKNQREDFLLYFQRSHYSVGSTRGSQMWVQSYAKHFFSGTFFVTLISKWSWVTHHKLLYNVPRHVYLEVNLIHSSDSLIWSLLEISGRNCYNEWLVEPDIWSTVIDCCDLTVISLQLVQEETTMTI